MPYSPWSPAAAEIAHVAPSSLKQECFLDWESLYFLVPARPLALPRECLAVSDFSPSLQRRSAGPVHAIYRRAGPGLPVPPGPALASCYPRRRGQGSSLQASALGLEFCFMVCTVGFPPLSLSPTSAILLMPAVMPKRMEEGLQMFLNKRRNTRVGAPSAVPAVHHCISSRMSEKCVAWAGIIWERERIFLGGR